jgi:hypothetical protein
MDLLISILFPLVPIVALWTIVRYGPVHSRWRRREHPIGFALFIGAITFLLGFIGPMILAPEANQGPGTASSGTSPELRGGCGLTC